MVTRRQNRWLGPLAVLACFAGLRDTGVGLPTHHPEQIFESFDTTKPHGTGMGLAITRSIVEAHGGRAWAVANTGSGATFLFTLLREAAEPHRVLSRG